MPGIIIHPGETIESLGKNQLKIIQDKNNYRFSMDSVILARFVHTKKEKNNRPGNRMWNYTTLDL